MQLRTLAAASRIGKVNPVIGQSGGVKCARRYRSGGLNGEVFVGDAQSFLHLQEAETADIIFLDPPFNLGKHYSDDHPGLDDRPDTEYEEWLKQVVLAAAGVLRPGGALYLYHLPVWAMRVGPMLEKHLTFRQWIAVSMKNGFVRGQRLYPAHYALMMFSKGELGRFSRPRIAPKLCRHCGGLVKDYGGYRSIIDEKGINLSDVWEDLSPVRHGKTKNRAANELPIRLFQRIFEMSGGTGLTYVDPFAGGGTGVVTAAKSGMLFRANDLVQSNCDLIVGRLDELQGKS